ARTLRRLPVDGVPLSVLANRSLGDGHALDAGAPLASMVLHGAAALAGMEPPRTAEARRAVWAASGVLTGEVTLPVLTLGLPGLAGTALGRSLAIWGPIGEPVHLSARQLLREAPDWSPLFGRTVFLCENPTVVAEAANQLGRIARPLVCTSTHPAAAATVLLRQLLAAGARLAYHGDFDWPGITIANNVMPRFFARPWRYDATSYRRAVAGADASSPLLGRPVVATWDGELSVAMREAGRKIEEERVIEELLEDVAGSPTFDGRGSSSPVA
ncbi:MAG: TIGR02679 family protein, partial [Candidatus Dormibacteraceae bacterium]